MKSGKSLLVCVHRRYTDEASCGGRGGERLAGMLEEELARRGLPVAVERIECFSRCQFGPVVRIAPGGAFFEGVGEEDLPTVIEALEASLADEETPS